MADREREKKQEKAAIQNILRDLFFKLSEKQQQVQEILSCFNAFMLLHQKKKIEPGVFREYGEYLRIQEDS